VSAPRRWRIGEDPVPKRALYPLYELAVGLGLPRRRLLRFLDNAGVDVPRIGHRRYVYVDELQRKLPQLWNSLQCFDFDRSYDP
jgi:hypothetical protein